ncbi:MAG TPA: hypothetical protein VLA89_08690, partial [Gemmatimonadales bacterium]|nr:hypothetical protein [Gemmatimonadales bacterium]
QIVQAERQACDVVVNSCEAKVALRDSLLAAQDRKIKLLLHKPHSFFSGVGGKAVLLGAGFLLGRAIH